MTCSDARRDHAEQTLQKVLSLLDEECLAQQIDEPIDRAARGFALTCQSRFSVAAFHQTIGQFLQRLYEKALPGQRKLPAGHAEDEALALLEGAYRGTESTGYYGALLDARDPDRGGMESVLFALAEIIKDIHRRQYFRWVLARHIDAADWPTRKAMAAVLLDRCRPWLPPQLQRSPAAQLADYVAQLLAFDMAITRGLSQPGAH